MTKRGGDSLHPGVGPEYDRRVPGQHAGEVEPGADPVDLADLCSIDAPEAVLLHGHVPQVVGGSDAQREGAQAVDRGDDNQRRYREECDPEARPMLLVDIRFSECA